MFLFSDDLKSSVLKRITRTGKILRNFLFFHISLLRSSQIQSMYLIHSVRRPRATLCYFRLQVFAFMSFHCIL